MFDSIALGLIKSMGHSGTVPGAIQKEGLPAALQRLEQALASREVPPPDNDSDDANSDDPEPRVSMAHRALPLLNMLKSAIREGDYIIWDK